MFFDLLFSVHRNVLLLRCTGMQSIVIHTYCYFMWKINRCMIFNFSVVTNTEFLIVKCQTSYFYWSWIIWTKAIIGVHVYGQGLWTNVWNHCHTTKLSWPAVEDFLEREEIALCTLWDCLTGFLWCFQGILRDNPDLQGRFVRTYMYCNLTLIIGISIFNFSR